MNLGAVKFMKGSSNLDIPVPKSARKPKGSKQVKDADKTEAELLVDRVRKVIEVCDGIFVQVYDSVENAWVSACPFTDQIVAS